MEEVKIKGIILVSSDSSSVVEKKQLGMWRRHGKNRVVIESK